MLDPLLTTTAEPFTYAGYRELLRDYLAAGYRFGSFPETVRLSPTGLSALVLMRHDIDFDLDVARSLAEVEREEGIQATYFFLLRTNHYNVLSKEGTSTVLRILDGGHHLGLHFDCAAYEGASESELAAACRKEAALLGDWFGSKVEIVSYHRPSPLVLTGNPGFSAPLPHTYTARFMKEMKYCSDSRGEWRHGDPRSTAEFAQRKPMHILIHPVWWNSERCPAQETVGRWLTRQIDILEDSAAANCTAYRKRRLTTEN